MSKKFDVKNNNNRKERVLDSLKWGFLRSFAIILTWAVFLALYSASDIEGDFSFTPVVIFFIVIHILLEIMGVIASFFVDSNKDGHEELLTAKFSALSETLKKAEMDSKNNNHINPGVV